MVVSLAILLFIIMDPFGNLVIINALLSDLNRRQRQIVILRESLIATSILMLAVFFGSKLLDVLNLKSHSLSISGGIVMFVIAMGMLFPVKRRPEDVPDEVPLIVPIAMPLIAGPSCISMVILFAQEHSQIDVSLSVLLASFGSAVLLLLSPVIYDFLGRRGSVALERLMGMLLIMISVQMILDGIDQYILSRAAG